MVMKNLHKSWFIPCCFIFLIIINMSYYQLNRKKLLKKAHGKYHNKSDKEKAAKYYQKNKEIVKERERSKYKMMSTEEKNKIKKGHWIYYYKLKAQYKE